MQTNPGSTTGDYLYIYLTKYQTQEGLLSRICPEIHHWHVVKSNGNVEAISYEITTI